MSIDEFRRLRRVADRQLSLAAIAISVPWFVIVFVVLLPRYDLAMPFAIGFLICTVVMAFFLVPLWLISGAVARKHGLICPRCGQRLIGAYAASVLRTGRCNKCHAEMFSDAQNSVQPTAARSAVSSG